MRRRAFCALLLALWTAAAAHVPAQKRPARIVSVIPAVTEMLFAIGAGPQVVGVGTFDRYPPEVDRRARVGALLDPDVEKILSLRPDLVAVYGSQTDLMQQLERAGIPIFSYRHAGLAGVTESIRALGERTGRSAEAEQAARAIEEGLADIRKRVAGRARPKALIVFGREAGTLRGIYASAGVGFLHDMVLTAGADDVLADVRRESLKATTELILGRRPEIIIEVRGTPLTAEERRAQLADWNALSAVPAVKNGRVYLIADERTVVPGPRVVEGTRLIAEAIHPDAFK
jgi:iron complex transport system substrate-binding protein